MHFVSSRTTKMIFVIKEQSQKKQFFDLEEWDEVKLKKVYGKNLNLIINLITKY